MPSAVQARGECKKEQYTKNESEDKIKFPSPA